MKNAIKRDEAVSRRGNHCFYILYKSNGKKERESFVARSFSLGCFARSKVETAEKRLRSQGFDKAAQYNVQAAEEPCGVSAARHEPFGE